MVRVTETTGIRMVQAQCIQEQSRVEYTLYIKIAYCKVVSLYFVALHNSANHGGTVNNSNMCITIFYGRLVDTTMRYAFPTEQIYCLYVTHVRDTEHMGCITILGNIQCTQQLLRVKIIQSCMLCTRDSVQSKQCYRPHDSCLWLKYCMYDANFLTPRIQKNLCIYSKVLYPNWFEQIVVYYCVFLNGSLLNRFVHNHTFAQFIFLRLSSFEIISDILFQYLKLYYFCYTLYVFYITL